MGASRMTGLLGSEFTVPNKRVRVDAPERMERR
jgi:hypothetical protein